MHTRQSGHRGGAFALGGAALLLCAAACAQPGTPTTAPATRVVAQFKIPASGRVIFLPVQMDGVSGVSIRVLIHEPDGAPNFRMRLFEVDPGGNTPLHEHDWEHEVYVLDGEGVVVTDKGERAVSAGMCVFVPGGEKHQFRNTGAGAWKFLCLVPVTAKG